MTTTTSSGSTFGAFTPPTPTPSIRPALRLRRTYPAWLAPVVVGAAVLAVAMATMSPWPVGVYYDDGIYVILGKALATGEGYRYLNLPGHPAATHYPPGYPALLALLWLVAPSFPENVALFKLANAVLLSLAAAGLFLFARRELALGSVAAGAAILLGCLTVPVLAVTAVLFSEPLFLAMLAVTLPACERALRADRPRAVVVAALLAGATALVRTLGLPLTAALVLGLILRGRRRAAALAAAVAAAVLLPWHVWTAVQDDELPSVVAGSYGSYTATFVRTVRSNGVGHVARTVGHNLRDLARPVGAVFAPGTGPTMRSVVVVAALGVFAVGAALLARRALVTSLFLLGYGAIVIAWPYAPDRFLWGVWPLLLLTLALGATAGVRRVLARDTDEAPRAARIALGVAAALLFVGLARYNARGYRERWWDAAQRTVARQLLPLVEWTQRNTRPDDVLASDGDPLVHLYTGRHVVPSERWAAEAYPSRADSASAVAAVRALVSAYPVRYLLLRSNKSATAGATAALRRGPKPELELLIALSGGGAVFRVTPDASLK
jgi:hypothetical protein